MYTAIRGQSTSYFALVHLNFIASILSVFDQGVRLCVLCEFKIRGLNK